MRIIFFLIVFINSLYFQYAYSMESYLILKINNKIITNVDINNEYKYLIALSPDLQDVDKKKVMTLARNSIIREKIKEDELNKFIDLNIKNEFIDTGKVKFVFRDFPFNYPALAGSMIVSCVPNEVRYEYMNALYKLQKSWVFRDIAKTKAELYKIMQSGGMQQDEFDACLSDINLENDILEGVMNAQKEFNIRSTPTFIVNGVLYSGNKNIKEFRQIIDKILSQ